MIDPTLPMELDDGTPVQLVSASRGCVKVKIPKPYSRDGTCDTKSGTWNYRLSDGVWVGGNKRHYWTLRNAELASEEYEDWFV